MNLKHEYIDNSFGLVSIGVLTGMVPAGRAEGFRTLNYDFLAFLANGEAMFQMKGGQARQLSGSNLIHVSAGLEHRYDPDKAIPWENYWMCFKAGDFQRRFGSILPRLGVFSMKGDVEEIGRLWKKLYDLTTLEAEVKMVRRNYLTHVLLMTVWESVVSSRMPSEHPLAAKVKRLMADNVHRKTMDFHGLAKELGLGYDNFRLLFKKWTGSPPHQCYLEMKIKAARSMLSEPGSRVSETAAALGFKDCYYFSRLFKRKTGVSPKQFARSFQSEKGIAKKDSS